jgi:hypothetical protein
MISGADSCGDVHRPAIKNNKNKLKYNKIQNVNDIRCRLLW